MVQIERMSTNSMSDVKMGQNWRASLDKNWRSPGPTAPRYFLPRYNSSKVNFESSTITFLNSMIALPRLNFGLCNSQDLKKIVTGKVDFYPDFEGITKIVQDTFANSQNFSDSYNRSTNIFTFLSQSKVIESEKPAETKSMLAETIVSEKPLASESNKEEKKCINLENTSSKITTENKLLKDSNMQQVKHGTTSSQIQDTNDPIMQKPTTKHCSKSKHSKPKKRGKSKSSKHKNKSNTIHDMLDDYYQGFEDQIDDCDDEFSNKLSPQTLQNYPNSCSSKLSQSFEKCWNYLQRLPPVKHFSNVMSTTKSPTEAKSDFVYVHNLDNGHLATENLGINNENIPKRKRMSSECETEDSFVIFADDNKNDPKRNNLNRKPSLCDSNDSFVICFGESSQSPEECFMFDDMEDRLSYESDDSSYYDDSSDCESDSEVSGSDSICSDTCRRNSLENDRDVTDFRRKSRSGKKVSFDTKDPVVHHMVTWSFAYHQARKGEWEQYGRDRVRFEQRIEKTKTILDPILVHDHRQRIFEDRFRNFDKTTQDPISVVDFDEVDGRNNNTLKINYKDLLNKYEDSFDTKSGPQGESLAIDDHNERTEDHILICNGSMTHSREQEAHMDSYSIQNCKPKKQADKKEFNKLLEQTYVR